MTQPPPPRLLQKRANSLSRIPGCAGILIIPHLIVGICTLLLVVLKFSLALFGSEANAWLVDKKINHDSEGGTSHKIYFEFAPSGSLEKYQGSSFVSSTEFAKFNNDVKLPVRYLGLAPGWTADYHAPGKMFPTNTWPLLGFSLLWNAITFPFAYIMLWRPKKIRRILETGAEAKGRISKKEITHDDSASYHLHFTYEVAGQSYQGKLTTSESLYNKAQEGDELSVIYDPAKPKSGIAIEFSPWEAVGTISYVRNVNK